MVRRDVATLVKWAAGSGVVTAVPHAIALPHVLATLLAWVGGSGFLITGVTAIIVGLTRLATETTRLVDAYAKLRTRIRQVRKRPPVTRKGGTP